MDPKEIEDAASKSCPERSTPDQDVLCIGDKCSRWVLVEISHQGRLAVQTKQVGMCVHRAQFLKPAVVLQGGPQKSILGQN